MSETKEPSCPPTKSERTPPAEVVDARQLFLGKKEICIEHDGTRYRLRITRRNKLILQK